MTTKHGLFIAALLMTVSFCFSQAQAADEAWRALPLIEAGHVAPAWQQVGFGEFRVEGDALRTEPSAKGLGVLVYTKEKLGNCQLKVVYRLQTPRSNSGVHIRMDDGILGWIGKDAIAVERDAQGKLPPAMRARMEEASEKESGAWYAVHHGFEVQISDSGDRLHRTGSIYSYAPAADLPNASPGDWRTLMITLDGETVAVELDGKPISRFDAAATNLPERKNWTEPKREYKRPQVGYIGLQTHDPGDIVYFREVSVRPIRKP